MKKRIILSIVFALLTVTILHAQDNGLIINPEIKLPKDSTVSSQLISDLNGFLRAAYNDREKNNWVQQSEKLKSSILLTQLYQINENTKDGTELKSHLNNITPIGADKYLVQISYIETTESDSKLFALFEIFATKKDDSYKFSSTLPWNTRNWETIFDEYLTFYYDNNNQELCDQYIKHIKRFDIMLENSPKNEILLFSRDCEDLSQLLRLSGVLYHKDYNGLTWSMTDYYTSEGVLKLFTARLSNIKVADPHDIFHGRSTLGIPFNQQNRLMVCGSAYAYAGNWGYSWSEIQIKFKNNFEYNAKTDWLKLYFDKPNFGDENGKDLFITQFINALIVQDLEREKGFVAVKELLASGNMYKNEDYFFKKLEELTAINKSNFNKKVGKLIEEAMRNI